MLILDEPVNGLDLLGMIKLRDMIRFLAKERNTTVFISSHIINEVEQLCVILPLVFSFIVFNKRDVLV